MGWMGKAGEGLPPDLSPYRNLLMSVETPTGRKSLRKLLIRLAVGMSTLDGKSPTPGSFENQSMRGFDSPL